MMTHKSIPGLVLVFAVVGAVAACVPIADSIVTNPGTATSSLTASGNQTDGNQPVAQSAPVPKAAHVGDELTLTGNSDGEQIGVIVVKYVSHAVSSDEFMQPSAGDRYVAVQFRLNNSGATVYSDTPDNGSVLIDSQGQQYQPTFADVTAGPSFPGSTTIAPGSSALGYVVYEVPQAADIVAVEFTLDSGFASDHGQWSIP